MRAVIKHNGVCRSSSTAHLLQPCLSDHLLCPVFFCSSVIDCPSFGLDADGFDSTHVGGVSLATNDATSTHSTNASIPPLIVSVGGRVRRLSETNLPVGLLSQADYASAQTQLQPGDRLIIVTDGVTEAANSAGDMFGDDRLTECARADTPIEQLLASVRLFCGDRAFDDDCTVLDLTFLGAVQQSPAGSASPSKA